MISQNYRELRAGNFFETKCTSVTLVFSALCVRNRTNRCAIAMMFVRLSIRLPVSDGHALLSYGAHERRIKFKIGCLFSPMFWKP